VPQAISGPLAAGLLALEGRIGSLKGWQILFLFEGLPAVLLGGAIWWEGVGAGRGAEGTGRGGVMPGGKASSNSRRLLPLAPGPACMH
jgi:hypothetical protein